MSLLEDNSLLFMGRGWAMKLAIFSLEARDGAVEVSKYQGVLTPYLS